MKNLFLYLVLLPTACFGQSVPIHVTAYTSLFQAYTGNDIRIWPAVPNMGAQINSGLKFTDTSLPSSAPSNPPVVVRCTDKNTDPGSVVANQSKSAGLGGSGDAVQLFNADSSFLHVNTSGGADRLIPFDTSTMTCGTDITANLNDTNPGSATVGYSFGSGSFDWTDASAGAGNTIYYGFADGNDAPALGDAKYVINKTTHHFTVTSPDAVDFTYGLPVTTLQAPTWQAAHSYSTGDYVSASISFGDWNGSTAWILGDLITPLTNNPAGCTFKLNVAGTRGTQPTSWSTGTTCTSGQTKTEVGGTETWRNITSHTFVFQLTSAGGTSGGSPPTWAATPVGAQTPHPDVTSTVSDNGLTWTNVSVLMIPAWKSFGGISKDSNRWCSAFSSNGYGHGPGSYNLDNADQGTGVYAACYDVALNRFVLLNTATGIQSFTSCTGGGTGYACTGGTLSKLTAAGPAYTYFTGTCSFPLHNMKGNSGLDAPVVVEQTPGPQIGFVGTCHQEMVDWHPFAAFNNANAQPYNSLSNHFTIGNCKFVNVGEASNNALTIGNYVSVWDCNNPSAAPLTSFQVGAPFTNPCDAHGVWAINDVNPPCDFADVYDSHLAFLHDAADDDAGPVCGTFYDAATGHIVPIAPYAGEEVCISTTPLWDPTVGPIGKYTVWRFTHTFNLMTNPIFDTQFGISQLSNDGKYLAFTSDWNGTLGDTSGNATNLSGPLWSKNTVYSTGQNVNPFSGLSGSGTNYGVWKATTGGTSGSSAPAWVVCSAGNAGATLTDNTVIWTCQGTNNAKGEVFIVSLR